MTEKEFENLKVGDKVWYRRPSADYKTTEVVCREIRRKKENPIFGTKEVFIDCLHHDCHCDGVWRNWYEGSLTKSEEWQKDIECYEGRIKECELDLDGYKKHLAHARIELAKAKAEEVVWTVDFDEGEVVRSTKRRWEGSAEYYEWSLGSPRYKPCEAEHEAYAALAKYHYKKANEAAAKCADLVAKERGWKQ